MSLIWPELLWLLLLVPALALVYLRLQQRRRRLAARYASLGLVAGGAPRLRRHIPPALFLAAFTLLVVALARPQAAVALPRPEGTVILVFDVSASMAADDVAPTRMEAAKAVAQHFVEQQPLTMRIGVVAFSNSGLAVQMPTNDSAAILAAIGRLAPQRGTSLGQGVLAALNSLAVDANTAVGAADGQAQSLAPQLEPGQAFDSAAIVLLTDGENTDAPDPAEAAALAAEHGVRIFPVGLGTAAGATVQLDGFSVHTRLDEPALRRLAEITGGAYFHADDQAGLASVYDHVASDLVVRREQLEVTALLAGGGMVLLVVGGALSLVWFGRVP